MKTFRFSVLAALTGAILSAAPALANELEWKRAVQQLIVAKQSYPRAAEMRGDQGSARVRISVAADGKLAGVELLEPTGSTILDREAVRLPEKVGVFPAPPNGVTSVILPITWKMS